MGPCNQHLTSDYLSLSLQISLRAMYFVHTTLFSTSSAKLIHPAERLCPGIKSMKHRASTTKKDNQIEDSVLKDSVLRQNRRRRFPEKSVNSKETSTGSKTQAWDKNDDADCRDGASAAKKEEPSQRFRPGTKSTTRIPGTDNQQQQKKTSQPKDSVLGQNRRR